MSPPDREVIACASPAAAQTACAALIRDRLGRALQDHKSGRISVMISGGRTPRDVLAQLLHADLDWARIELCASDERLVPVSDPASTEGMVRGLFAAAGQPLHYCSFGADPRPDIALATWQTALAAMRWPVALAFLGIGEDGHIASLFPGRAESGDQTLWAAAVPQTAPHPHPRLTLGARALCQADLITLVAAGPAKQAALRRALTPGTDPVQTPAALLQGTPAVIFTA
jgi:6-phosphogluconolactonase